MSITVKICSPYKNTLVDVRLRKQKIPMSCTPKLLKNAQFTASIIITLFFIYSLEMIMKLLKEVNLLCLAQPVKTIVLTIMLMVVKFLSRRWQDFLKIVELI